jgi:hypothetical protein
MPEDTILQGETLTMDAIRKEIKVRAIKKKQFVDVLSVCDGGDELGLFLSVKTDETILALIDKGEVVPFDDVEGFKSIKFL